MPDGRPPQPIEETPEQRAEREYCSPISGFGEQPEKGKGQVHYGGQAVIEGVRQRVEELQATLWLTIAFILIIASLVQLVEIVMKKMAKNLFDALGIYLPLITTNCAVLGVALLNIQEQHSFVESALYGFGAAVGFSLVLVLFAAMRERIAVADVPVPFRGASIGLITAGLMALAFMGFTGLANQ